MCLADHGDSDQGTQAGFRQRDRAWNAMWGGADGVRRGKVKSPKVTKGHQPDTGKMDHAQLC